MSVSSTTNRATFSGNGTTTVFAFPYFLISSADLLVTETDTTSGAITTKALTTHYTFSGSAAANGTYPSGGSVTMLTAPATGKTLSIVRVPDFLQSTSWSDNDADPAAVKELAFDKLTLEVQRLKDLLARAAVFADGFIASTFSPTLPAVVPANYLLGTNSAGTAFEFVTNTTASPQAQGSGASAIAIAASTGITPTVGIVDQVIWIAGSGGAVTVSANPQIVAGTSVGQVLELIGTSDTNTVTLQDGTGLSLNGPITLGLTPTAGVNRTLGLRWDGSVWVERYRT